MEFLGAVPHNYFMRTKFLILLSVVLSLSLITAPSNAAVKAGAKCTKAGAKATAAGKKFTCVKSGNRLVWNKGVAVRAAQKPSPNPVEPTPTPTPVATSTPTPKPTPETPLPIEYSPCSVLSAKVSNSTGAMRCSWMGHSNTTAEANQRFIWLKHVEFKVSTSQSNNYTTTPVENASCTNSGDTFDVAGGKLECRWVNGKKLQWIKINTVKKTFTNAKSPVSIDICKLQMSASKADRTGRNSGAVLQQWKIQI